MSEQEKLFKCQEAQAAVDAFKKCFATDSEKYEVLHLMEARLRGMQQEIEESDYCLTSQTAVK